MPPSNSPRQHPSVRGDAGITQHGLLQSIVELARIVFGSAAASVFLVDRASGDLVFEAVSGEGEENLIGTRFPRGTGIAGWVAASGQPMIVDDVSQTSQFAVDAAESTGYVPRSIMAAPLLHDGDCIGVLEVLDRGSRQHGDLTDVDLLGLLATEVALAMDVLVQLRWAAGQAGAGDDGQQPDLRLLQRVAERLPAATEPVAATVSQLLVMADQLLTENGSVISPARA